MQLNNKTIVRAALCVAVVTALGYSFTVKSETKLLPFQGKLTDANGQVIEDKAIVVQFKMYDAPVGGNAKWNGEVQMLTVNGGLVNTTLGTKASLKNVDFSTPTYLEITIDANGDDKIGPEDPPLLPRQSIIPAVYAVEAGNAKTMGGHDWSAVFTNGDPNTGKIDGGKLADKSVNTIQLANNAVTAAKIAKGTITSTQIANGAVSSNQLANEVISEEKLIKKVRDSLVPPGTIIAFGGNDDQIPSGWMRCSGQPLSSKDYPALYQAISTNWGAGYVWSVDVNGFVPAEGCDFNAPCLEGVFLRGLNRTWLGFCDVGPDEASRTNLITGGAFGKHVGSYQHDAFQMHNHKVHYGGRQGEQSTENNPPQPGDNKMYWTRPPDRSSWSAQTELFAGEEIQVTGSKYPLRVAHETRPVNAYVNYIIKY